jgi:cyanophycinase
MWLAAFFAFAATPIAIAEEQPRTWMEPVAPISGSLVICGGGRLPEEILQQFLTLAGGEQAQLVVVPTASSLAGKPEIEPRLSFWRQQPVANVTILHTRSRDVADTPEFNRPLENATAVWFVGGHQGRLTDTYLGTRTEKMLRKLLDRGGVIGGTSAGAAMMSPVMIRQGNPIPETGPGFGFLPGTVIDQHFLVRRRQNRLMHVLDTHPGLAGLGIDEGTALIVQGRRIRIIGDSQVLYCLPEAGTRVAKARTLKSGDEVDLVALSRAAIARAHLRTRKTTPAEPPVPQLARGTLVIVGGGAIPAEATQRFIAAAGGVEAPLVVVSTATGDTPPESGTVDWLRKAGARNIQWLHARNHQEAADPKLLAMLKKAKGVWFLGGRQWRLVDAFLNTVAEQAFHDVLARGGVIGGSSAGATIQAEYLVRGNPTGNSEIMAEGYEEGFGFLPGVAIDQHFSERNRFADMADLKHSHPELLGLGIDEGTALIVQGHEMEVLGASKVAVFADEPESSTDEPGYELLRAGDRYDLKARRRAMTRESQFSQSKEDQAGEESAKPAAPSKLAIRP